MPKSKKLSIPDYVGEARRAAQINMNEVVPLLDAKDKDMLEKVTNFALQFNFKPVEVIKKIRSDRMFLARFAKEPGRQGIHEKLAAAYIKSLPQVENFKTLGKSKYVIMRGAVLARTEARTSGASDTAKTLDFSWECNGKKIYASHKFTKSFRGGGAQDNQYADMKTFIQEANPSRLAGTYFLAIADGDYYKGMDTGTGVSKLNSLKEMANRRNVFALSIDELQEWMKKHCR